MSNPYEFYTSPKNTQMNEPIPGRRSEMKQNLAGGYAFKASDFVTLKRWLLTGSESNAFYQKKEEMTEANVKVLERCVVTNPEKVAEEIAYASDFGISNNTPIFALVYLSKGDFASKKAFRSLFPKVVRTGSHLYQFLSYVKQIRGMGKTIHGAVKNWLSDKSAQELEYQFLKYQNRYGWSGRDVLRAIKPIPGDELEKAVYNWVAGGSGKNPLMTEFPGELARINAYEAMKRGKLTENEILILINGLRLTHEMIPANIERTKNIWNALYHKMPVGATLRNLGNLTSKDIMADIASINILEDRFSKENLKKARLHPLTLASALNVYRDGGATGRGRLTWRPVPRVEDILNGAIEVSFEILEPTDKHYFLCLDISSSMWGYSSNVANLWMKAGDVAGIMALATAKAEPNYFAGGFAHYFVELPLRKTSSYRDILNHVHLGGHRFGGTNASLAFKFATENRIKTDVFVLYTDSESWLGNHPTQALKEYRDKINPEAKAIYVTLVPYGDRITLVDPKDTKSYDIAGFSSESVKVIQMIANGDF